MGFNCKKIAGDRYEWSIYNSAYGAGGGIADSLAEAKVEMAIMEADIFEHPYPPQVVKIMRSDYERFAADFRDPPIQT